MLKKNTKTSDKSISKKRIHLNRS